MHVTQMEAGAPSLGEPGYRLGHVAASARCSMEGWLLHFTVNKKKDPQLCFFFHGRAADERPRALFASSSPTSHFNGFLLLFSLKPDVVRR
jgi:hypothetical protein